MKHFPKKSGRMLCCIILLFIFDGGIFAQYAGLPEVAHSPAFRQFTVRPATELSKIIYLIDRFGDSKIEVLYDGNYYSAPFAAKVARWFLARRYSKEEAEAWVLKWCNTSVPAGNLIWVKLPDGQFLLAREILLDELKKLQAEIAKIPAK